MRLGQLLPRFALVVGLRLLGFPSLWAIRAGDLPLEPFELLLGFAEAARVEDGLPFRVSVEHL
jgi:hypothetical protein